ncbi:hypothetical protein C482_15396, partial [Natrialba chahannaoensis JCM 10990]
MPVTFITDLPDASTLSLDASVQSEMTAAFDEVANNGEYRIELRDDDPGGDHPHYEHEATVAWDDVHEHTITDLVDGEQYSVRIRTQTDYRTGRWLSAEELTKIVPASDVTVSIEDLVADVSWTDNSDFRGSYQIYRRRTDYDYGGSPGRLVGSVGEDSMDFTDDGAISPDQEYVYMLRTQTQWVHADSELSDAIETEGLGLNHRAVPPRGWYVEVDHPSGTALSPQVLDGASRQPTVNGYPRVNLPVPHDSKWHSDKFNDADLRVWHDESRDPISTLEHRQLEPGQTTLEGRGGTQLDRRVIEDVELEETHEFIEYIIEEYTDYIADVDDPAADIDEDVVLQFAEISAELQQALETIPDDSPLFFDGEENQLKTHQTGFFGDVINASDDSSAGLIEGDEYNYGEAAVLNVGADQYVEWEFEVEHEIPEEEGVTAVRYEDRDGVTNGYRIVLNGEVVQEYLTIDRGEGMYWDDHRADFSLEPGTHSLRIEAVDEDEQLIRIDCVGLWDDRFGHEVNSSDEVNENYALPNPALYPDAARLETVPITTPVSIQGITLSVETNDGTGLAELGIGVDGTDEYDTVEDALEHTLEYSEPATEARARVGIGRSNATRDDETPTKGFEATT